MSYLFIHSFIRCRFQIKNLMTLGSLCQSLPNVVFDDNLLQTRCRHWLNDAFHVLSTWFRIGNWPDALETNHHPFLTSFKIRIARHRGHPCFDTKLEFHKAGIRGKYNTHSCKLYVWYPRMPTKEQRSRTHKGQRENSIGFNSRRSWLWL